MAPVNNLMQDRSAAFLLSRDGKRLRNRCMHYPFQGRRLDLNPWLPMCGVVEATCPGVTYEEVDLHARRVLQLAMDFLGTR